MQNREALQRDLATLKKRFKAFLIQHPAEKKNSVGYVHDNLKIKHLRAALWLEQHYSMRLDAYNLHDLILNYAEYRRYAAMPSDVAVVADLEIPPDAFNPLHLIEYFRSEQGDC